MHDNLKLLCYINNIKVHINAYMLAPLNMQPVIHAYYRYFTPIMIVYLNEMQHVLIEYYVNIL